MAAALLVWPTSSLGCDLYFSPEQSVCISDCWAKYKAEDEKPFLQGDAIYCYILLYIAITEQIIVITSYGPELHRHALGRIMNAVGK